MLPSFVNYRGLPRKFQHHIQFNSNICYTSFWSEMICEYHLSSHLIILIRTVAASVNFPQLQLQSIYTVAESVSFPLLQLQSIYTVAESVNFPLLQLQYIYIITNVVIRFLFSRITVFCTFRRMENIYDSTRNYPDT